MLQKYHNTKGNKTKNPHHINSCYSSDLIAEIKQIKAGLNEDSSYKCNFSTPILLSIVSHFKYSHDILWLSLNTSQYAIQQFSFLTHFLF